MDQQLRFFKASCIHFSATSAAIIWGALRRIFANEKAGKARSPISEFLEFQVD